MPSSILIAGLRYEANSFAPGRATLDAFRRGSERPFVLADGSDSPSAGGFREHYEPIAAGVIDLAGTGPASSDSSVAAVHADLPPAVPLRRHPGAGMTEPIVASEQWSADQLRSDLMDALAREQGGIGQWIHGRIVGVLASPELGSATHLAVGVSALPAGFATEAHEHEAEEVALILSGRGRITIDGREHRVEPGSAVLTPARSEHVTSADDDGPLLVLWVYAPTGSEHRWLSPEEEEGAF